MQQRRALTLLLLTLVLPGTAQLVAGHRQVGRIAMRIWLGLLAVALLLLAGWVVARGVVLALLTQPTVLSLTAILLIALGIAWPVLVLDAWRLGRTSLLPAPARRRVAAVTTVLVLLTCLLPMAAGRRMWAAGDLISGVFGSGKVSSAVDGRYNVLLLGGDAGRDRIGLRPDSITLASIDVNTGQTVLFALPRNLQNVPLPAGTPAAQALPAGWSCGDACLLNALYTWGSQHPTLFPEATDAGAEAMKQAVSAVVGLPVNYYVLIDLAGFRRLIDAMGGIDITVGERVPIGGGTSRVSGYIEPGKQHLDGYHALWYARSRHGSSDYQRMARQRCVMAAMVNQLDPQTVLARFQDIADASKDVMSTDIPSGELPKFLELGSKVKGQRVTSVQFVPPLITPAHPDYQMIHTTVTRTLEAAARPAPSPTVSAVTPAPSSSSTASRPPAAGGSTVVTTTAAPTGGAVDLRAVCSAA